MKVLGIAHTAFNVTDMDRAVKFYEDVFGGRKAFEINRPDTNEPWIVYLYIGGGQFVELFYGGVNVTPYRDDNAGFSHLCLSVADINEAADSITRNGAPLDIAPKYGADGNWQCWTHDPDGIKIELMQISEESPQMKFIRNL